MSELPDGTEPSAEAWKAATDILWPTLTVEFPHKSNECRRVALALDRYRAAGVEAAAAVIEAVRDVVKDGGCDVYCEARLRNALVKYDQTSTEMHDAPLVR